MLSMLFDSMKLLVIFDVFVNFNVFILYDLFMILYIEKDQIGLMKELFRYIDLDFICIVLGIYLIVEPWIFH